ncbi:uncharacterized protein LOC133171778 [Saccostrea echinata]|uniref:uncharacterized protein LOC133171778 n=1 Tax=Saccostrea echinata TaxID=191078 RepID=UPI002A7F43BB|nr:uncharacterized protein LOC133171778 [Saccostrea echinata]
MKTSMLIRSSALLGTFLSSAGRTMHLDMYEVGCDVWQLSKEMGATIGHELLSLGERVNSFATTTSAAALSFFSATDLLFFLAFLLLVTSVVGSVQFVRQFNTAMKDLKSKMAGLVEENIHMRLVLNALLNDADEAEKALAMKLNALDQEQKSLAKWLNFHTEMFSIRLDYISHGTERHANMSRRDRR